MGRSTVLETELDMAPPPSTSTWPPAGPVTKQPSPGDQPPLQPRPPDGLQGHPLNRFDIILSVVANIFYGAKGGGTLFALLTIIVRWTFATLLTPSLGALSIGGVGEAVPLRCTAGHRGSRAIKSTTHSVLSVGPTLQCTVEPCVAIAPNKRIECISSISGRWASILVLSSHQSEAATGLNVY
jgi:hypothetical protein